MRCICPEFAEQTRVFDGIFNFARPPCLLSEPQIGAHRPYPPNCQALNSLGQIVGASETGVVRQRGVPEAFEKLYPGAWEIRRKMIGNRAQIALATRDVREKQLVARYQQRDEDGWQKTAELDV